MKTSQTANHVTDSLESLSPRMHLQAMKLLDEALLSGQDRNSESFKELTDAIKLKFNPKNSYCYMDIDLMTGEATNMPLILGNNGEYSFDWYNASNEQIEARDRLHIALTFMILDDMLVNMEHVYQYLQKKISK